MATHIHKLKRLKYRSGNIIYFCTLPDCNYKINIALALGKRSICWRCGESFIMDDYSLRLARPHCESCHRPKNIIDDIIDNADTGKMVFDKIVNPSLIEKLAATIQAAQQTEDEDEI